MRRAYPYSAGMAVSVLDDDITRRRLLAGGMAGASLLVTGCAPGRANPLQADTRGTREVADIDGPVTLPVDPRRVVALDQIVLANMLRLGFPADRIAGVPARILDPGAYRILAQLTDLRALPPVKGSATDPDLDSIAAARPDMILSLSSPAPYYRDARAKITTLGVPFFGAFNGYETLDESMRLLADVGRAVGRERQADAAAADFRGRLDALRDELALSRLPTVQLLQTFGDGIAWSQSAPLLDELRVPGNRPRHSREWVQHSPEELLRFDADVLYVFGFARTDGTGTGAADLQDHLSRNPLWSRLPAVRGGRMHFVEKYVWNDYSLPALDGILADIARTLP